MMIGITIEALRRPIAAAGHLALLAVLAGCAARSGPGTPPAPAYVPGFSYHLMMAEIAARRGALRVAAEEYLNAAERTDDPQISQRATEFAFEHRFDSLALRAARRWAALAPEKSAVHLYLARLYLRRHDFESALGETERALGPPAGRTDEDYLELISELGAEDNPTGLTRLMARLAAGAPPSAGLSLALAMAAMGSQDFDLALHAARGAARGETASQANQLIARALMARGSTDQALAHLDTQLAAGPSRELELERARILAAADRHVEALQWLDGLASRYAGEPEITRLRALVSLDAGDTDTAWENFTALLSEGQDTDECYFYMAQIAERGGRYDQALRFYRRVGEGPFLVAAQAAIVRLAERNADVQSALGRLEEFAADHPRFAAEAMRLRAGVLERAGRFEEALDALDEALAGRPEDGTLLLARGALLELTGRLEDALADMRAAVALAPDSAIALNALGYTLADRTRHLEEAYRLIRRAIEIEPDSGAILDSLGWVFYRQRRLPEARTYLALAYAQFPDAEVAAHLGEVLWQQGEREAARRIWEEALERSPGNRAVQAVMGRLMAK